MRFHASNIDNDNIILTNSSSNDYVNICPNKVHRTFKSTKVVISVILLENTIRFWLNVKCFKNSCRDIHIVTPFTLMFKHLFLCDAVKKQFNDFLNAVKREKLSYFNIKIEDSDYYLNVVSENINLFNAIDHPYMYLKKEKCAIFRSTYKNIYVVVLPINIIIFSKHQSRLKWYLLNDSRIKRICGIDTITRVLNNILT